MSQVPKPDLMLLQLASFQCFFFIIQLSMTSFARRETLKTPFGPHQQNGSKYDEKPMNQTNKKPLINRSRNSLNPRPFSTRIEMRMENLLDSIEIYEWRSSTDYPIVGCNWKRIIFDKSLSFIANKASKEDVAAFAARRPSSQIALLQLEYEQIVPLEQFQLLSIAQFLYAFKETLVGFERLNALFGACEVVAGMVGVNAEGKVKVWVSRHYHINAKMDIDEGSLLAGQEHYMISRLKGIFVRSACDSSTFRDFFKGIDGLNTFIDCFKFIDDFSIAKRIIVSKKIQKEFLPAKNRPLSPIINLKPIARTPKFIANIQQKKSLLQESIPSLYFDQRNETPKDFYCSELKTKETLNQFDYFDLSEDNQNKTGKIVKNNGRHNMLSQVRSLKNLYENENRKTMELRIDQSSIEQQMRRLLDDQPESEFESGNQKKCLRALGREVRQSLTLL